ncbi:MAG: helicase-related protein [Prevotella sp.]
MSILQRLRYNIAAIDFVLNHKGEADKEGVLKKYTGFGGMNFILKTKLSMGEWTKSEQPYYSDTRRLQRTIHNASKDYDEYKRYMESLKTSVLTAYYTPNDFVSSMMSAIYGFDVQTGWAKPGWIRLENVLDPAAGDGVFMDNVAFWSCSMHDKNATITGVEKDLLTAMILKAKFNTERDFVYADSFEHFPKDELGKYDLVSTNVPFGDIRVFDPDYTNSKDKVRRDAAQYIHRYYVLKGLDTLHDGGIEAFIITSNYLNKDGEQIAEALKHARLIGAYRLANNLFKDAGTEVGTDLLVLQKDEHKESMTLDETFLLSCYESEGCPTNMFFDMHPDHVIATSKVVGTNGFGDKAFVYNHDGGVVGISRDMRKVLSADMANVDVKLFNDGKNGTKAHNTHSENRTESTAHTEKATNPDEKKEKQLKAICDCYNTLFVSEATKLQENVEQRRKLNQLYDAYVAENGVLNREPNKTICNRVQKELLALEVMDGRKMWQKSDIFFKPVAFATDEINSAETAQEALAQSLNDYGKVNVEEMMALTGLSETELMNKLDGDVYYNPLSREYEIKAKFISGNVVEKIHAIRKMYNIPDDDASSDGKTEIEKMNIDLRVMRSLRALEDAVPTPIPFTELDFNLGERWIDCKLYSQFGSEFFSMDEVEHSRQSSKVSVVVNYDPNLDHFVACCDDYNEKIYTQYQVKSECSHYNGLELFEFALHNTCPKMMKFKRDDLGNKIETESGRGYQKEEDSAATQIANAKIEEIRNGWVDWLTRQPKEVKDDLARKYNERFNCFVKPKYDGSHQKFPGLDFKGLGKKYGVKDLYQSQKDCIWMLVQNGGGICDHEVGSGKTLIMCIAAHEMKRLGLVHKPLIIGLKANVGVIAETYRTAYPQAKILYATNKDFRESERVDFFNRMKNNDYDCVIMSHDQFGRLPQSERVQADVLQEELDQVEASMEAAEGFEMSNGTRIRKALQRRKENLKTKIQKLQHDIAEHKDKVVDFAMMGIDHIFVDESHMFKNLGFTTRHDRVAGLGNTLGSKRAYNLLMAIRTIQMRTHRDLGATFLSGTTVTNSLTELYSLFRYLRPMALAKQGITCFDAWAAIFTKKSTEFEFGLTNQIILKERFRYFIKVPELAQFYNEITDFRTAEDVGIERPKKHARLLNIEPTPDQAEYIKTLMEFAKTGDFNLIGMPYATKEQERAKMLYATDKARKMSLDMRMIDPSYEDHPRSKASMCAKLVKRYYDKYNAVKGTQLIFSDLSTYQGKNKGWNVYEDIKQKLVDMGIPASEIRFIQEAHNEQQKQQIIDDTNDGKIRVLMGSTSMLGTGVNCQERVVCVHHLDTPWRPSDLEQRDGRAIRKGNIVAKEYADNTVDVIIYAVRRSLDAYKFGLLNNKQTFISQLKRGQLSVRTLDEGTMDEKSGMNFAEYMAVLSGNTDLLERAKLEKHITALEAERKTFYRDKAAQEKKQERMKNDVAEIEKNIADAKADNEKFTKAVRMNEDSTIANDIAINGFTPDANDFAKSIGKAMLQLDATARTKGQMKTVGNIYGFDICIRTDELVELGKHIYDNKFFVHGGRLIYAINPRNRGKVNRTSPTITSLMPVETLQRLPNMIAGWEQNRNEWNAHIEQLETIIKLQWGKDDELAKLRKELSALDLKINQSLKKDKDKEGYTKAA